MTTATAVLKTQYGDDVAEETFKDAPFAGQMETMDEDWDGDGDFKFTVQYGTQQGTATNYADAEANQTANEYLRFTLPRGRIYGTGSIGGEVLRSGAKPGKGRGAMINVFDREKKGLTRQLQRALALVCWGNGGGAIARIGATTVLASDTIVLDQAASDIWFEKGQYLQFSVADGTTGALKAAVTVPQVTAVIRGSGTSSVKLSAVLNVAVPTIALGDYIFWRGYHGNTAGNATPMGWDGYVPMTDPVLGVDSFLGADRGPDPTRLAGLRFADAAGGLISDILQKALAYANAQGVSTLDSAYLHPTRFAELVLELQDQKRYIEDTRKAPDMPNVGYKGCRIVAPYGEITVFADRGVPRTVARVTNMSVWKRKSLGKMFHIIDDDGNAFLRKPGLDEFEWRHVAHFNQVCESPFENMNVTLLARRGREIPMKSSTRPLDTRNRKEVVISGLVRYNGTADLDVLKGRGVAGATTGGFGDLSIELDSPYPAFISASILCWYDGGPPMHHDIALDPTTLSGGSSNFFLPIQFYDLVGALTEPPGNTTVAFEIHVQQIAGEP